MRNNDQKFTIDFIATLFRYCHDAGFLIVDINNSDHFGNKVDRGMKHIQKAASLEGLTFTDVETEELSRILFGGAKDLNKLLS